MASKGLESADWRDLEGLSRLSAEIREWEPLLDLYAIPGEERIYEPDGTLYGCLLSDRVTLSINRRETELTRGDLFIVPAALAIDMDRAADLLCFRHAGAPPIHFRERFIQVWGIETFKISRETVGGGLIDVLPRSDFRRRLPYLFKASDVTAEVVVPSNELHLLVGLSGSGFVGVSEGPRVGLEEGRLAIALGGTSYKLEGDVEIGLFILESELEFEARVSRAESAGPECAPGST